MAELAALSGATLLTVIATGTAIARGARVTLDSTGAVSAAASTVRGDYVTATAIAASAVGAAVPLQSGCIVPMALAVSGTAVSVGDTVYTAASGFVTGASTSTVIVGKANTACASSASVNVLFEVLLENPL